MWMVNRKGEAKNLFKLILWIGGIFLVISVIGLIFFGEFGIPTQVTDGVQATVGEAVSNTQSNGEIFNSQGTAFLDFIYGQVPTLLVDFSNPISAAIIVIGVWVLLFLTFGDIISVFGTFSQPVSWVVALVLAVLAANLKVVLFLSVIGLVLASGLGTIAVFVNIIGIFVVFIGFNYGSDSFRDWVLARKQKELGMRAAMGSAKAKAGLQTLGDIGETTYKLGKNK